MPASSQFMARPTTTAKSLRLVGVFVVFVLSVGCKAETSESKPVERPDAVDALIEKLSSPDVTARREAALELGRMDGEASRAVFALATAASDEDQTVRLHAHLTLRDIVPECHQTIPILVEALKTKDEEIQEDVLGLVRDIGPGAVAATPTLIGVLKNAKERNTRLAVIEALGALGPGASEAVLPLTLAPIGHGMTTCHHVRNALVGIGTVAMPALASAIKHEDPKVRAASASAAVFIDSTADDAMQTLIELLKHRDAKMRRMVAETFRSLGSRARIAEPALTELLTDEDGYVRRAARQAIERIRKDG